jgi:hypothetical protein
MSIRLNEENAGKVLAVQVSGKLAKADYEQFLPEFERLVRQHGKLRVLFDMTDFHGWEAGAAWEDTKFAIHHYADIEKIAMVGEKRWQQGMADVLQTVYASDGPLLQSRRRRRGADVAGRGIGTWVKKQKDTDYET